MKIVAISSLQEVYRLLYEDLQYTTLYWLGNIFYNIGNYELCYKSWKLYLENIDKSFATGNKKANNVTCFMKNYEFLCEKY